jgi:hypothetical protein
MPSVTSPRLVSSITKPGRVFLEFSSSCPLCALCWRTKFSQIALRTFSRSSWPRSTNSVLASKVIMAKSNFIPSRYSSLTITDEFRNGGALACHLGPACFSFNAPAFSYLAAHTDLTLEQDLDNTAGFPAAAVVLPVQLPAFRSATWGRAICIDVSATWQIVFYLQGVLCAPNLPCTWKPSNPALLPGRVSEWTVPTSYCFSIQLEFLFVVWSGLLFPLLCWLQTASIFRSLVSILPLVHEILDCPL